MNHDYNTQRKKMALPEYGRNVQKMVDHIKTLKDRDERSRAARSVIQIMGNLNPNLRDSGDVKHKLWDHLTIIADFELDIDAPYPPPAKEILLEKPREIAYKKGDVKYMHYGRIMKMMIDEACKMEEGEKKDYLIVLIANQMKKASATWNRSQVNDDVILKDLRDMSGNKLNIPENMKLLDVKDLLGPRKKKPPLKQKNQHKKKYQSRRQ
ncbi:MAG TPA: DUF4290 domain-containing protein [Bacteroidetes bacterium]|nr:DUF4290 domain-containing protein [Bacteroidota bacterium]